MSDYGLVANGCLAHHFWHVRYLGTAILHSAKLFWQISNMPSILNNCAEFELIANSSWFWILMKIVFSVKLFFGDCECGQMAYYHFFYQTYGTRRYPKKSINTVFIFWMTDFFPKKWPPSWVVFSIPKQHFQRLTQNDENEIIFPDNFKRTFLDKRFWIC